MINKDHLRQRKLQKIRHAERWFKSLNAETKIKVEFKTQFEGERMARIITDALP